MMGQEATEEGIRSAANILLEDIEQAMKERNVSLVCNNTI